MLHCHPEGFTVILSEAKDLQTIQPSPPDRAFCFSLPSRTRNTPQQQIYKQRGKLLCPSPWLELGQNTLPCSSWPPYTPAAVHASPQCTPHRKPKPSPNSNTMGQTPSTQTPSTKTSWSPTPWIKTSWSPTQWCPTPWIQYHGPKHNGPLHNGPNTMAQNTMVSNTMDPIPWSQTQWAPTQWAPTATKA